MQVDCPQFGAPTIYLQTLTFVDKSCRLFYDQSKIGVLKNVCLKNMVKVIIETAIQQIFHVNVNFT